MSNTKNRKPSFNFYWIYAVIVAIFIGFNFFSPSGQSKNISISEFKNELLTSGDVEKVVILNREKVQIYIKKEALLKEKYRDFKKSKSPQYESEIGDLQNFENFLERKKSESNLDFTTEILTDKSDEMFREALSWIIVPLLFVGIWMFAMKKMGGGAGGGQIFSVGKSKAKLFDQNNKVKTTFKDVAGLEGAKEEVQEIVSFLKEPSRYTNLGGKIPKGALLVGPPGTGKTLLAKAVAGEAEVPFFSLSGSDFVEMFVGVGASRVRDLFKQAKEKSPSIIFIDEIDAIGKARGKGSITGGNDERENTLNQLLTEMDGFGTNTNVIVLAATNRVDVLDKALLRAGRFDRRIHVELPNLNERKEIFEVHLKPLKLGDDIKAEFLAKQTPGFSGADIANVCNESALIAARKRKDKVEKQDFLDAVDRIVGGLEKKSKIIKPKEKKRIAYHEAGHATISWLLEHAHPLVKVTIVPRGQSLGAAWYLPEERQITTKEQMLDEMCATLGGRAAEKVIFDNISTGALSDLEKVTKQAQAMVTMYGLSDKIGNISYYDSSGQTDFSISKPYSEQTAKEIDSEISMLAETQYSRAISLLTENKENLSKLAKLLLEKEVIFKEDLENIFGKRKFDTTLEAEIVNIDKTEEEAKKEDDKELETIV